MMKFSKAFAPASLSNLNCGFDTLGLAIDNLGDEVLIMESTAPETFIGKITNGEGLPYDIKNNISGAVVDTMLKSAGYDKSVEIELTKGYAFGSGLGSSATSAVAAAVAANDFLGSPFSENEVIQFALDGEFIASQSYHGDNVIPTYKGGIVLVHSVEPIQFASIPAPDELKVLVIFPQVEVKTSEARAILDKNVSLEKATRQWSHLGAFVAGCFTNDYEMISHAVKDEIIESQRKHLIPHFDEIRNYMLENGALAFGITGSGPSMFAFVKGEMNAMELKKKAMKFLEGLYDRFSVYESNINSKGAFVVSNSDS